jgi:hypothetical protein
MINKELTPLRYLLVVRRDRYPSPRRLCADRPQALEEVDVPLIQVANPLGSDLLSDPILGVLSYPQPSEGPGLPLTRSRLASASSSACRSAVLENSSDVDRQSLRTRHHRFELSNCGWPAPTNRLGWRLSTRL